MGVLFGQKANYEPFAGIAFALEVYQFCGNKIIAY
jgi:hypothetical protein